MGTQEHPLLNSVVLQTVFKFVEFNVHDFGNYRLVSKGWWDATLKVWRSNVWLKIHNDGDKSEEEFFQDVKVVLSNSCQLNKYPIRKYELKRWNIGQIKDKKSSRRFWNYIGPLMTHLKISGSKFEGPTPLRQIIFNKTPNLSHLYLIDNSYGKTCRPNATYDRLNLKERNHQLVIKSGQIQKNLKHLQISTKMLPLTWMEVLLHFPNIEVLEPIHLYSNSGDRPNELTEMLQALEAIRKGHDSQYLANLTELNINRIGERREEFPSISTLWRQSFQQLQFPLKKLSLSFSSSLEYYPYGQILRIHCATLEILNYNVTTSHSGFPDFPNRIFFQRLTWLKLGGKHPDLKVLEQCPSLKTLLLECGEKTLEFNDALNNFTHQNLEEFSIRNNQVFLASQVVRLACLMPNLKKVSLGVNNGGFEMMCQNWPTLESLTISPFRVEEKFFLGVQQKPRRRHPNIRDLKHLKYFEIIHPKGFTDYAIRVGLLLLENLKEAHLRLSAKASQKTFDRLKTKFSNCRILKFGESE